MKSSLNVELDKHCNARCSTCPREAIKKEGKMSQETFQILLRRIEEERGLLSHVDYSGFGESILHPDFKDFMKETRNFKKHLAGKALEFAVVTNGHALNEDILDTINNSLDRLSFSFTTSNPAHYSQIYMGLAYEQVVCNLKLAAKMLDRTKLVIHLTPTKFTIADIESTSKYLRGIGIREITLWPITFNRAGNLDLEHYQNREYGEMQQKLARKHRLKQLEKVFIPNPFEMIKLLKDKSICPAGRACLSISYEGNYHGCFNDIGSDHVIGNIQDLSLSEAMKERDLNYPYNPMCFNCNTQEARDVLAANSPFKILINYLLAMKDNPKSRSKECKAKIAY